MVDVLLDRVSKQYGEVWALRDVTLNVADGEAVVILGPTGSGKTTLLRIAAGLESPTSGDILFDGVPADPAPDKRDVSMMFAESRLYPRLTVRGNIGFPLSVRGVPEDEKDLRVETEARAIGITRLLERMPEAMSAGETNLVALAKAMTRAPALFLVDEPMGAVDPKARHPLRRELRNIQQGYGATAIYASHDQEDALILGDRLLILDDGAIRQVGLPADVYNRPGDTFVATFLGSPEMSLLRGERTGGGVTIDGLTLSTPRDLPREVLVGVRPERWTMHPKGLTGRVMRVEDLGTDVYVTLESASGNLTMRWPDVPPQLGTDIVVAPDVFHVFDPNTGLSLFHSL